MKKRGFLFLALLLAAVATAVCGCGTAPREGGSAPLADQRAAKTVYLLPGAHNGTENAVAAGAEKLSAEENAALFVENGYRAALSAGEKLPVPTSAREDVAFYGWFTTVDALITYFEEMPDLSAAAEDMFLYADWRTEVSLPHDPVNPDPDTPQPKPDSYLEVTRAETGAVEYIELFKSFSDVNNTVSRLQFYNESFVLYPGDTFIVYTSGIFGTATTVSPKQTNGKYGAQMENGFSSTGSYMKPLNVTSGDNMIPGMDPVIKVIAEEAHTYRMYIKFYDAGGWMTVYAQAMD